MSTTDMSRRRVPGRATISLIVAVVVVLGAATGPAGAISERLRDRVTSTPSDPRATFVPGNVITCAGAGFGGTIQVGSPRNGDAGDANVAGTVSPNSGPIDTGHGEQVDVTILGPGVTIEAVVVKGGNGYNVYSDPAVLPPSLGAPQHYVAPRNGGANVPFISHWFICYRLVDPPSAGSLVVTKAVIADDTPEVSSPASFTAIVSCAGDDTTVTFPGGGGVGSPVIEDLAPGTVCTVVEQTGGLPPGMIVSYDPPGADSTGVTIPTGGTGITVGITNDFSSVVPETGRLAVTKELLPPPPGVDVPGTFTVDVLCDDGTQATVTVPGTGGPGVPVITVSADAHCSLEEVVEPLAPGWIVTYRADGGQPGGELPFVDIVAGRTATITIINDASEVLPSSLTAAPPVSAAPAFTG